MDAGQRESEILNLTPEDAAREIAQRAIIKTAQLGRRVVIGVAGGPGSGKSTLAEDAISILNKRIDGSAVRVPMDGFHQRHAALVAQGIDGLKGAPETFDPHAFVRFLTGLKAAKRPMEAPSYSRKLEDVVENAFTIPGNAPILLVEGNYLLLDHPAWRPVRELLDLAIFIMVPRDKVRARLIKRRAQHGHFTPQEIQTHVDGVDLINYDAVAGNNVFADLTINLITPQ